MWRSPGHMPFARTTMVRTVSPAAIGFMKLLGMLLIPTVIVGALGYATDEWRGAAVGAVVTLLVAGWGVRSRVTAYRRSRRTNLV